MQVTFYKRITKKIDQRITTALKEITDHLQLERCYIYLIF